MWRATQTREARRRQGSRASFVKLPTAIFCQVKLCASTTYLSFSVVGAKLDEYIPVLLTGVNQTNVLLVGLEVDEYIFVWLGGPKGELDD